MYKSKYYEDLDIDTLWCTKPGLSNAYVDMDRDLDYSQEQPGTATVTVVW